MGQTNAVGPAASEVSRDEPEGTCAPAREASAANAPHNPTASRSAVVQRLFVSCFPAYLATGDVARSQKSNCTFTRAKRDSSTAVGCIQRAPFVAGSYTVS
jgi:hypothetical protein